MQKLIDLIQAKKIPEAGKYLRKIRNLLPRRDQVFFKSLIYQLQGELKSAAEGYINLLANFPEDLGAAVNLAAILNGQGEYEKALSYLLACKETANPNLCTALFDSYFGLKRYDKAQEYLDRVKPPQNEEPELLERRAALLLQQKNVDQAIAVLQEAEKKFGSTRPNIYGNLAAAFNRKGMPDLAIQYAEKATEIDPKSWQFRLNKANSLMSLERLQEAHDISIGILEEGHRGEEVLSNIARIENLFGNIQKSIDYCIEGLSKNPDDPLLLCILADNYSADGNINRSYELYKKSLFIDPENPLTNWHYALALLRDGDYLNGWVQYKWGFERKFGGRGGYPFDKATEWLGQGDIDSLVIWGEQGIGDILMFSKFLKYIPPSIRNIELRVEQRLASVFSSRLLTRLGVTVVPAGEPHPKAQIPIGNLPAVLWESYAADQNKLKPFFQRRKSNFPDESRPLRLGIAWRGGISERMQGKRSIPLGVFRRIDYLNLQNIQIVVLQYNPLNEEIDFLTQVFGNRVVLPKYDARVDIDSWVAHIDSCDLIVSVDNSAVHFAGALGVPTLAILPRHADFRWGREGSTNIWYGSLDLLRGSNYLSIEELAQYTNQWISEKIPKLLRRTNEAI